MALRPSFLEAFGGLALLPTPTIRAAPVRIQHAVSRQFSSNVKPSRQTPPPPLPRKIQHDDVDILPSGIGPRDRVPPNPSKRQSATVLIPEGFKFPRPSNPSPFPKTMHLKHRYDPLFEQFTKMIMRDGKLSQAQRHMSMVLGFLQSAPTPKPSKPLTPNAPNPAELPLNPLEYLRVAVDSVAPLIKVRSLKGMAGGGAALDVPVPLNVRQRRRFAIKWILELVRKKQSRVSGRERFAYRLASELISIVQGSSSIWARRQGVHKSGTTARANLNAPQLRKKGMRTKQF